MKLTTKEASQYLGLGLEKVRTLAKKGVLAYKNERLGPPDGGMGFTFEVSVLDDWLLKNKKINQKVIVPRESVTRYSPEEYNRVLREELGIPYKPLDYRYQPLAYGLA